MTRQKGTIALKWHDFDQNNLELGEDDASFNISSAQNDNGLEDSPGSRTRRLSVQGTGIEEFFPFGFPTSNL